MAKRAHFEAVDIANIEVKFSRDKRFRYFLRLPFKGREGRPFLGILGQNPSRADGSKADPTIRYLSEYAWQASEDFGGLTVFNLYACVDTRKEQRQALNTETSERVLRRLIREHQQILVVTGKLTNQGGYRFKDRMKFLQRILQRQELYKFALNTDYPPHPGNTKIFYHNYAVSLDRYTFADLA